MQPDDRDQQQRNPSEQDYKKSFNPFSKKSGKEPPGKARQVADKAVKEGVEKGTEAALTATGAGAAVAKPVGKVAGKLLTIKNASRGAKAGAGAIILLLLFFGTFLNSPQQIFSHTKETTTDWSDKFLRESYHLRTARIFALRYFDGKSCDIKASIMCLMEAGATEREIALMKREGLLKDGDYEGMGGGRYRVNTIRYYEDGQEKTINSGGDLIDKYPKTADLVAKFQRGVIDPKALTFRSPQGVHVLFKFGVMRNNPIGTSTKLDDIVDDFREQMAGGGGFTAVGPSPAGEINSTISSGASGIETDKPEEFGNALDDTADGLNQNVTGCTKESFMQQISAMNKIIKAPLLIKYNASIQALFDQDRDSKLKAWEQSSMAANMLSKQGRYKESKEKIYSDSGAYTLITQGNVRDDAKESMSKFANGIAIDGLEYGGGSCQVSPVLGQFIVDPDNSAGVYGTSSASVDTMEWLTPQALMLSTGKIVPDPEDDLEGGYNAGNAFASGASALQSYLGRGAGNRAITKDEFDQIDRDAPESSQIISDASSINSAKNNPVASFLATLSSTIHETVSPTVTAKEPYKDKYRGDLCTDYDVKEALGMWPSWSCDPIMAQLPEHLDSDDTDPAANTGAMTSGGYIYADNTSITEDVFYGNLPELLAACRARGITDPVQCVPKAQVSFTPFSGGPKIFNNNFCDDLSLKSPVDITTWPDPICNRPGPHSYDFVDGGSRLAKYINGPIFLEWYATCVIWNHPIMTESVYLNPKYLPGDGTPIYKTPQCSGLGDNASTLRLFQLYVKDHNMADSLENVGTDTLGDDTCSDPIYPNPNKFCALDNGTRTGSMATAPSPAGGGSSGGGSSGGGSSGGGGTITPATGTDQELARQIIESGRVTGDSRYMNQIRAYANGDFSCHINSTILQLIASAAQSNTLYITSLNRQCTGVLTASGTSSYHYRDSGGHAVDFGTINGVRSTGGSSQDIAFLNAIVGTLPSGSAIGQIQCRPSGSVRLPTGIREFSDSCNHVHIQVPVR